LVTRPDPTGTGYEVIGSHTYAEPGVHTVVLRAVDDTGVLYVSRYQYVVVYDPSDGFVTGGGWLDSPAGACHTEVCDEATMGKANFGFVSKYKKGATQPSGDTEFHFSAGGLNFHSDSYDWLVVNQSGENAQFKGAGTVNGEAAPTGEPYRFMIWAGDGDPDGDDTFRIKIWWDDAGGERVVYDNGFGQAIGGGSIVIHTAK
jgi:PKD repeat protein